MSRKGLQGQHEACLCIRSPADAVWTGGAQLEGRGSQPDKGVCGGADKTRVVAAGIELGTEHSSTRKENRQGLVLAGQESEPEASTVTLQGPARASQRQSVLPASRRDPARGELGSVDDFGGPHGQPKASSSQTPALTDSVQTVTEVRGPGATSPVVRGFMMGMGPEKRVVRQLCHYLNPERS